MKNTRHAQHFSRALQYLQNHYTDDIDLHRIAEEAGLSAWHWHRLYRDVMGETLHTTVKWMRLHRAAWLIAYTDKPVTDIARECGYRNAQSFARSFRDEYGLSPQQYRARPQSRYPVHIENRAAVAVTMLAHYGECQRLGDSFYHLGSLLSLRGINNIREQRSFSIHPTENPYHSEKYVAVAVPVADIAAPLACGEIPAGRYAILRHQGPYADLDRVYDWLAQEWFPAAGQRIASDRPVVIEYHDNRPETPQPQRVVDICAPLAE